MDQARLWSTHDNGFSKSIDCQLAMEPITGIPADDAAGEQVDDNGQIEPALAGPYVGNINTPFSGLARSLQNPDR